MERTNQLGEFLRVHRELVLPSDVGIPEEGRRRLRGLRREEAAALANISPDRYLRIEQGLEETPPDDVLANISRAFRLDEVALAELNRIRHSAASIAGFAPVNQPVAPEIESIGDQTLSTGTAPAQWGCQPVSGDRETVSNSVKALIQSWPYQAAFVRGTLMDVLSSNRLASALSPLFSTGTNVLRSAFLDPSVRELYRDWYGMLIRAVAHLHSIVETNINDAGLARLIGELAMRSPEFRTLWAQPAALLEPVGVLELQHPQIGALDLHYETLAIADSAGQVLVVFHAEPESESETAFRRLAAISVGSVSNASRPLAVPVPIDSKRRLP